jgi:hypothetical protein
MFRCEPDPRYEIAIWMNAANVYDKFAGKEPKPSRRREIYDVVMTCVKSTDSGIQHTLKQYETLSREAVETIIKDYSAGFPKLE